ncbi:MAG TPA: alpha/beta hydrolase fold domain-containing protein [Mycobacterium sp.]|nr:alpha/beta hydrolase fold domain-containing protein [Mycobacterium sp.]
MHGRLADPDATLGTDPRADPRMIAALAPFGMDGRLPVPKATPDVSLDYRLATVASSERRMDGVFDAFADTMPAVKGVATMMTTIPGVDGNDIELSITHPIAPAGELPGVVHFHGGGMTTNSAADAIYTRIRENLADTQLVVIGVEFRNAGGRLGPHPFPAGLNDCASATRWVYANRTDLGISHVITCGESGGGNLALTTALTAKREGWLDEIAGVYAQCPFLSGRWYDLPDDLPSLRENDGYFLTREWMGLAASLYDPAGENSQDATCYAGWATDDDLRGLPPHTVSVNELDPLRDEGLLYYRRLVRAGVPAVGRIVAGTAHACDLLLGGYLPDVFAASMRDVHGFAASLT